MNYIDRLLHRAVALPRAQADGLFDPFEQAAEWLSEPAARDPPAPAPTVLPTAAQPAAVQPIAAPAPAAMIGPAAPAAAEGLETPTRIRTISAPPAKAGEVEAAAADPRIAPGTPPARPLPPSLHADPTPPEAPKQALAKADAFMQALAPAAVPPEPGVAPARPRIASPQSPAAAAVPGLESSPAPSRRRPIRHDPGVAPPVVVVTLRPPRPPPLSPRDEVRRVRRASGESSSPAPPLVRPAPRALPPVRPAAPAGLAGPAVVVLSPGGDRLDDLAHSSAIRRFGIGQS